MAEDPSTLHDVPRGDRVGVPGLRVRRAGVAVIVAVIALALANFFGQASTTSVAAGPGATLTVDVPDRLRGGLLFQARLEVRATSRIQYPRLVFDRGWTEGMQINTIEPAAMSESSRDGKLVLSYDTLAPGDLLRVWMQFQVDPTRPGKRPFGVEIDDQTRVLARVDRDIRVLP